jgi:hypothetical protein
MTRTSARSSQLCRNAGLTERTRIVHAGDRGDSLGARLLEPPHEKQDDEHDQDDAEDANAAVAIAVAIAAEPAAESTDQEDDEDDDEDEPERHDAVLFVPGSREADARPLQVCAIEGTLVSPFNKRDVRRGTVTNRWDASGTWT